MKVNRKEFLVTTAAAVTVAPVMGQVVSERRNMCGHAAPPMNKVRVGIIGLGMRGIGAVQRLSKIRDVDIVALCDLIDERVATAQRVLADAGRHRAQGFGGSETAWERMMQMELDLVYIVTPWRWHAPMSITAMENDKHVAVEVPAAVSIEECWQLVKTSEKTGKHCMMLENCCYDFFEMQTLYMVREGLFGELTHAEGAYIHELCSLISDEENGYQGMWRLEQNKGKNGNLYPTHGLGPVAQCMNINRGNLFSHLVSMSSQEAAFTHWAQENNRPGLSHLEQYRGDMNTTLIKCFKGQTIMIQHDTSTPRPYSRIHLLQGSKGMARKWPEPRIAFGHSWLNDQQMKKLAEQYEHPLCKTIGEVARKVGGHGGMDFKMDYRLIYCLKNGLPLDQDVYDAAAWSCVIPLSIKSVANDGRSIDIPDFTQGRWRSNQSLGIVDVNSSWLPVVGA